MKHRVISHSLMLLAVFLALTSTALASSTWYVDGVQGKNKNDCKSPQTACKTIGHAISLASSGDSIMVAAATYTENLTIRFSLKVIGSGAKTTIVDGGGVNTVVTISSASAHVSLSKVTIRNGFAATGGGINNSGRLTISNITVSGNSTASNTGYGGGIYNSGTLKINYSTISANSANSHVADHGGGIYNLGTLTINDSTVSGNSAGGLEEADGGGISNQATLTISNTTISENGTASGMSSCGGGIANGGTLTINNSTISGNSAGSCGGHGGPGGGGIFGTATLQNTVVANNPSGGNCRGGTITSNGYNLSSDNTCNFNGTGDLNNTDPKLGQLGNYGGPTQTIPLLSASPAIDAGNPSGCTDSQGHLLKTDQRGRPRPDKEDSGGCDRAHTSVRRTNMHDEHGFHPPRQEDLLWLLKQHDP
jgi:hypothetical protein